MTAFISVRPLAADVIRETACISTLKHSLPAAPTPTPKEITPCPARIDLADLSAATAEELHFRAYFLSMAISNNHKLKVIALVESNNLNTSDRKVAASIMHATKLLTCASLFLVGLESGGMSNSKVAVDFLLKAFHCADRISPCAPAKQLISMFGDCEHNSFNGVVSRLVVQALGDGVINATLIDRYIVEEVSYRKDISQFACGQSVCVLKDHLPLFA